MPENEPDGNTRRASITRSVTRRLAPVLFDAFRRLGESFYIASGMDDGRELHGDDWFDTKPYSSRVFDKASSSGEIRKYTSR